MIDEILTKDLLYNDITNQFEPLDYTEGLEVELLQLPVHRYKYIQLTGIPLNPNYAESFQMEVIRNSDGFVFSETSQPDNMLETQFWVNYHEQNPQQNGRIYFNENVAVGTGFTIRYPFVGTANNARNIYALANKQLYELQKTNNQLNAGNYQIKDLADGVDSGDGVNKGQLDNVESSLQNNIDSNSDSIDSNSESINNNTNNINNLNVGKISTNSSGIKVDNIYIHIESFSGIFYYNLRARTSDGHVIHIDRIQV